MMQSFCDLQLLKYMILKLHFNNLRFDQLTVNEFISNKFSLFHTESFFANAILDSKLYLFVKFWKNFGVSWRCWSWQERCAG